MTTTHYRSCHLCEAACGVAIEVDDGRVTSIRGDHDDPLSRGYLCPKAAALVDIHEDPDRLRQPLRRTAGGWEPIGWDEAFDEVAARLGAVRADHGDDAIAIYQGNPSVHSLGALTFGQLFLQGLRTRNRFSATSADQLPHMLSSLLMFGHQLLLPVPDLDRTDFFLILGANPLVSQGSLMTAPDVKRRLAAIRARGGRVVVIDPRRTETAAAADQHLFIRPGTDALLLLGLLEAVLAGGAADLAHLAPHTRGLDALRALAARFPAERVSAATGIAAPAIRELARAFAAARAGVCYGRFGLCTTEFGGLASYLVNALNLVTGHLDRPGGAMFTTPAIDLVDAAARVGLRGSYGRWRSRVRGLPEFGGELPVAVMAEEMEAPGPGQIRALITTAGNPVLSVPNGARLERALPGLDFMVSIDIYLNETTRHANLILPPTFALERDHYDLALAVLSVRNVAKYSPALFPRAPEQRHDWEIFLELASRLHTGGGPLGRGLGVLARRVGARLGPRALLELGLRLGPHGRRGRPWRRGLTLAALERAPHGVDLGPLEPRLPGLLTGRDRHIDLAPALYLADVARLERALDRAAPGELRLIGRRQLRSNNSWMHNSLRLVKGPARCTLLMHPDDAAARGLRTGQRVVARTRVGAVEAALEVSDEVMAGVVSLPHGWGHHRDGVRLGVAAAHAGVSANDLTDETLVDQLSGTASFSGVPIEVSAAAPAPA